MTRVLGVLGVLSMSLFHGLLPLLYFQETWNYIFLYYSCLGLGHRSLLKERFVWDCFRNLGNSLDLRVKIIY